MQRVRKVDHKSPRMTYPAVIATSAAIFLALNGFARAANPPVHLPEISGPLRIDGIIDEPQWQEIDPLPVVTYQPTYGAEMTERTHLRIAYDHDSVYLAAAMYTGKPENIRGRSLYRDRYAGDDIVALLLDTFNDNETAMLFFTNPLGTRFDTAISDDAAHGRRSLNADWGTHWDVATSRSDEGWFAEFRIPFTSLRFQDSNGTVSMGVTAYRYIPFKNERHIYPDISPDLPFALLKPSLARDVILQGIYSSMPVYISPYFLVGNERSTKLAVSPTSYENDRRGTVEFGANIKYSLSHSLTLDATVNTDFAQVEADDQRLNLERFSLFFPEKRPFFHERSGIFEFGFEGSNRLFHSRRIGLVDGIPVRLLGGLRLVGRIGGWDAGLLQMQTAGSDSLPGENFGVLRARRQVLNANSNIGFLATTRLNNDGERNAVYGLDGILRLFGDEYLTAKWAQSLVNDRSASPFQSGRAFLRWTRRRHEGFTYHSTVSLSGDQFEPGVGFERRRGYLFLENELRYQWFMGKESGLRQKSVAFEKNVFWGNDSDRVESAYLNPSMFFETKRGATFWIHTGHRYENVPETFSLAQGVDVKGGGYWFSSLGAGFRASRANMLRPRGWISWGQFYDGRKLTIGCSPQWMGSKHLHVHPNYEFNRIRFTHRRGFSSHILRVRLEGAFNRKLSATGFFQYSNIVDFVGINARLRYHFKEGNDLWLVYDEDLNTDRRLPDETFLPRSARRALFLKLSCTVLP